MNNYNSNKDIVPHEFLIKRLFISHNQRMDEFDDITREIHKAFKIFYDDFTSNLTDSTDDFIDKRGGKTGHEVKPIVQRYSIFVGPYVKTIRREFGNVRSLNSIDVEQQLGNSQNVGGKEIQYEINITDNQVKVVLDMPGINEKDLNINTFESKLKINTTRNAQRQYTKIIDLPGKADIETMRFRYNNGILEVIFDKKKDRNSRIKEGIINLKNKSFSLYNKVLKTKTINADIKKGDI